MSQSISLYKQLANHKLFNKTINFDLKRIKLVLKKLNHPEKKLKNVINFLGSSGKFTTLHSIKSFIAANNQTATAYISPSLKDIKERFWMGERYLTHQEIKRSEYFFLSSKLKGSSFGNGVWIISNSLLSKKVSNLSLQVNLW